MSQCRNYQRDQTQLLSYAAIQKLAKGANPVAKRCRQSLTQITIAVGYELANDLRVCLALSISDILRAHVVPRLRAVPMILTLVTM